MSLNLDTLIRPLADSVISTYGKPVTLRSLRVGDYDPNGGAASNNYVNYATKGVFGSPSKIMYDTMEARSGDASIIFADLKLTTIPKAGDLVTLDDFDWTVIGVMSTFSGALAAVHTCLLRK